MNNGFIEEKKESFSNLSDEKSWSAAVLPLWGFFFLSIFVCNLLKLKGLLCREIGWVTAAHQMGHGQIPRVRVKYVAAPAARRNVRDRVKVGVYCRSVFLHLDPQPLGLCLTGRLGCLDHGQIRVCDALKSAHESLVSICCPQRHSSRSRLKLIIFRSTIQWIFHYSIPVYLSWFVPTRPCSFIIHSCSTVSSELIIVVESWDTR